MKKIVFLLLLVFCLTASVPAMAAETEYSLLPDTGPEPVAALDGGLTPENAGAADRPAVGDVLSDWEANGYPDDIGGVFYDQETGLTTILLVRPSAERENELKALIPGAALLPCVYSYNELLSVQKAVSEEMASQPDGKAAIHSAGIGYTATDGKVTGFGESGKEFRVVVTVDESVYTETANRLKRLYGDKVYVETGTALVPVTDSLAPAAPAGMGSHWQFTLLAIVLLGALAAAFMLSHRRHSRVMQTTNGDTVTAAGRMTRKQVEAAVKEAAASPGDVVFERIRKEL